MLESTFSRTIENPKPIQSSPKHRPLLRMGVLETAGNPGLRDRHWDQRLVGGKRTQRPRTGCNIVVVVEPSQIETPPTTFSDHSGWARLECVSVR
jgi:hypothetical protein